MKNLMMKAEYSAFLAGSASHMLPHLPIQEMRVRLDLQARGFTLTAALRSAVESEASSYGRRFPHLNPTLHVRLFDVNGRRGGIDKGCLVEARVGHGGTVLVSTDLDSDLYRAIPAAFEKLERSTQSALDRRKASRS